MSLWSAPLQVAGNSGATVASLAAAFAVAVTPGNMVVVTASIQDTSGAPKTASITDSHGNVYTQDYTVNQLTVGTDYYKYYVWHLIIPLGSGLPLTVTVTPSVPSYMQLSISEYPYTGGIPTADSGVSNTGTTSPTAGTIAVTASGPDLLVAMYTTENATTNGVGAGFTAIYTINNNGATNVGTTCEYQINATTSTVGAFASTGGSQQYSAVGLSYKLVPGPGYTIGGAATSTVGSLSAPITFTPGSTVSWDVVTITSSVPGDTVTPSTLTFSASGAAQSIQLNASTAGARQLTATTLNGGAVTGSPWTVTATGGPATSYAASGATSGYVGVASSNITLTPSGTVTSTITPSDGGAGGMFAPATRSWVASSAAQSFTYSGGAVGTPSLSFVSSDGLPITGQPFTFTVLAAPTGISFDTHVESMISGLASTAIVTALVQSGGAYVVVSGGNATYGPVQENTTFESGAYYCRVTLDSSVIPPLTVPVFGWNVGGQTKVDYRPTPCSVLTAPGLTPAQALELILSVCVAIQTNPLTGPAVTRDVNNLVNRVSTTSDATGGRATVVINPATL